MQLNNKTKKDLKDMKKSIEQLTEIILKNNWLAHKVTELEILAHYGDGSALVGYIDVWTGLNDEPRSTRRVVFINVDGDKKWDMIAE